MIILLSFGVAGYPWRVMKRFPIIQRTPTLMDRLNVSSYIHSTLSLYSLIYLRSIFVHPLVLCVPVHFTRCVCCARSLHSTLDVLIFVFQNRIEKVENSWAARQQILSCSSSVCVSALCEFVWKFRIFSLLSFRTATEKRWAMRKWRECSNSERHESFKAPDIECIDISRSIFLLFLFFSEFSE